MLCYYCNLEGGQGGTHYGVRQAVAACPTCGAGLCPRHAARDASGVIRCIEHREPRPARRTDLPLQLERVQ
jgi:hypothetical protein